LHKGEVGGGVGNRGEEGGVIKREKRIREIIDGLGDAMRGGEGDEDAEAAIVLGGGGEVEATDGCRVSPTISGVSKNRG
jgi:hypothetical protein